MRATPTIGPIFRFLAKPRQPDVNSTQTDSYSNPVSATLNGIVDLFRHKTPIGTLKDSDRLDGKTCLITGANSGLGLATAIELARRGAHIIMACRSGIPQAAEEVKRRSGSQRVEMVHLDLADLAAIRRCCDELKARRVKLDRVILNAGLVPQKPARTAQNFEMMFGVHVVGNMQFITRLLADGSIPNRHFAQPHNALAGERPRIIFVSSESHRSGTPIDLDTLGRFVEYSPMGSIAQYGHSKLVMTTYARELSRRLADEQGVDVAVHALCPGPINSNIAREAPRLFKPLLGLVMGALFASPAKAAAPVLYLACSPQVEDQTGLYLHLMVRKEPAPQALDQELARAIWDRGQQWLAEHAS